MLIRTLSSCQRKQMFQFWPSAVGTRAVPTFLCTHHCIIVSLRSAEELWGYIVAGQWAQLWFWMLECELTIMMFQISLCSGQRCGWQSRRMWPQGEWFVCWFHLASCRWVCYRVPGQRNPVVIYFQPYGNNFPEGINKLCRYFSHLSRGFATLPLLCARLWWRSCVNQ